MKASHSSAMHSNNSRRSFLKKAGLAAAAPLTFSALAPCAMAEDAATEGLRSLSFVRLRKGPNDRGWKYLRVKTVQGSYPKAEDEEQLLPSKYGGNSRVQWKATGRFRTEQVEGRWWMVDPDGHPFLSCGVNVIRRGKSPAMNQAIEAKGGERAWSKEAVAMLRQHGFNTAGNWSTLHAGAERQSAHEGMPYVYFEFGSKTDPELYPGKRPHGLMECFAAPLRMKDPRKRGLRFPVFHSGFEAFCAERCQRVKEVKDDPWLLGYYTDNELPAPSLQGYLEIDPGDPLYGDCGREARRWWAERGGKTITEADSAAWAAHAFDWYYRVTTAAIRQHDPEHLQLGSRYYSWERNHEEMWAAAGRYLDVVTVNPYGMNAVPLGRMRQWSKWANNKPVMIGEFYVKGADAGVKNAGGAGDIAATQGERGLYYQNYVLALLESAVCVGWHWHQYADAVYELPKVGEMAVNKGLMNAELKPYDDLLDRMTELNQRAHEIVRRKKAAV